MDRPGARSLIRTTCMLMPEEGEGEPVKVWVYDYSEERGPEYNIGPREWPRGSSLQWVAASRIRPMTAEEDRRHLDWIIERAQADV